MAIENYSRYQQSVIRNFYENRDSVALQRAQEILTDLYLAEGKKKEKLWDSLLTNLERIGIPKEQVEGIRAKKNLEQVAQLLQKKF